MTDFFSVNFFLPPPCRNLWYIMAHVMSNFSNFSQLSPLTKSPATSELTVSVNPNSYIWGMSTYRNTSSTLA